MTKFKVGDRVHVVAPAKDFHGRPESFCGSTGCVRVSFDGGCDVDLDGVGDWWSFADDEIELISPPEPARTLLDEFAMAALTGLLSDPDTGPEDDATYEECVAAFASSSYDYARAMMKEREKEAERG